MAVKKVLVYPLKTTEFGNEFKYEMDTIKRMDAVKTLVYMHGDGAVVVQYGMDRQGHVICLAQAPNGSGYYVGLSVQYYGNGNVDWAACKHYKSPQAQFKEYERRSIGTIRFAPTNIAWKG